MKKTLLLLGLASSLALPFAAQAKDTRHSVSVSPAWVSDTVDGVKVDLKGASIQYKGEFKNTRFGVVNSLTYAEGTAEAWLFEADVDYLSVLIGPSYRFNKHFTVYGQIGAGYISTYGASDTGFAYGFGVHVQPFRHFFFNAGLETYEDVDMYKLGVGYMF